MGKKIPIGISSCLLGQNVRYDGGHKYHSYIAQTLGRYFEFIPICPEAEIGLGIPREPIRLVRQGDVIRCIGTKDSALDVTDRLTSLADAHMPQHAKFSGYIFKKESPSCGMERVKVYGAGSSTRNGVGIYAAQLMRNFPELPVEEEGRLGDPELRENFIQRVFVFERWRELCASGLEQGKLVEFHARHKFIFMSHHPKLARDLGAMLAQFEKSHFADQSGHYFKAMMQLLKKVASRKTHANVLQHIQGYLKKNLAPADKAELEEIIHQYRSGLLPLVVPITLLRHHFRHHPDPYIQDSHYLAPHPSELCLLNHL